MDVDEMFIFDNYDEDSGAQDSESGLDCDESDMGRWCSKTVQSSKSSSSAEKKKHQCDPESNDDQKSFEILIKQQSNETPSKKPSSAISDADLNSDDKMLPMFPSNDSTTNQERLKIQVTDSLQMCFKIPADTSGRPTVEQRNRSRDEKTAKKLVKLNLQNYDSGKIKLMKQQKINYYIDSSEKTVSSFACSDSPPPEHRARICTSNGKINNRQTNKGNISSMEL